jgi:hypothetical protein
VYVVVKAANVAVKALLDEVIFELFAVILFYNNTKLSIFCYLLKFIYFYTSIAPNFPIKISNEQQFIY